MFVIEVIPLKRAVRVDSLSYFSATSYLRGTILRVPLRNNEVLSVVIDSTEVSGAKAALRAATFSLRKLPHQADTTSLAPSTIHTAEALADYHASWIGAILYELLSPEIRSGDVPLPHTHHVTPQETHAPEVLQGSKEERHVSYRALVRETFAHSGSVLYVVPTSAEIDEAYALLSPGIEQRTITLSSTMTKRQIKAAYQTLEDFSKSKLIIATPTYSVIERHDLTTVIIEYARSQHYKERVRPYLDYRDVLTTHAKHTGRRVVLGDLLPRSEEEEERRSERYQTAGETPKRLALPGKLTIVRMKDKPDGNVPFRLFSEDVAEAIRDTRKRRRNTFLFAARRGIAPVVACIDCGHIFRSPVSGAPYSLFKTHKGGTEERWFVCASSGQRERAADTCTACSSWRLRERGIGIQYVQDEFQRLFPTIPLILFDHLTASTYKKACFLKDKFYSTKGAVMLGTKMALPYLTKTIDTSVVINMDALYATPTWKLQEENLALLLELREKTSDTLFVQTRTEDESLLTQAKQGAVEQFYNEELELRKTFNYPPYTTLVHLTWQGKADAVRKIEKEVHRTLSSFEVTYYAAPPTPKGARTQYGLIRVASKDWPRKDLVGMLRRLPPAVRVVINPDRII